ncbi:MAG: glutamate--tRNA ligase [Chitinophagales bacterium]|nr:glutamate--tRNA ligase [Bacteroidota bacterium]MBP7399675.1 glutamate--tRNA ligase [Chitinophagales bacterium]MBK8486466.1 glutamate--tRNA ligase [Bacteroidota bacterium]MBK8683246.1 glutamate--tRNA ligase [Bacteroidota bacterium]MBP8754253.1 glutamate--tRNA ligase [Chitinophagales bacterium]
MSTVKKVRLRYAPSPTGPQHIGGIRTALFNYLFVKKNNGTLILRSEDTDQSRFVPGAEDYIINSCKWAGITFDEGIHIGGPFAPYRQSERKHLYLQYAQQLIESGNAYYAFDTQEELEDMRKRMTDQGNPSPAYDHITRQYMKNSLTLSHDEVKERLANNTPYVIRISMPRNEEIKFNDLIRGWVVFNSNQLDDKVLFKSDGMPTYHLANVVDDYLMQITHVVRGEEWLPSAPTHVILYRYLGWEEAMPLFAHLPLVLKPEGNGKLSKRDGDRLGFPIYTLDWENPLTGEKISGLAERGFLPEAYMNFLAMLGWHPGGDQEVFSPEELIEAFTIERVGKSGARFDPEKAKWINQQHIKMRSGEALATLLQSTLDLHEIKADKNYVAAVCELMKERAVFIPDLYEQGIYFFKDVESYDETIIRKKWKKEKSNIFESLAELLENTDNFTVENLEKIVKQFMTDNQLNSGEVMPILRLAMAGGLQGPPVFNMMHVLGKNISVNRLIFAIKKFNTLH